MIESPDAFDGVDVRPNANLMFDVVGYRRDWLGDPEFSTLIGNFENKQLAETWLRLYLEKYVRETYFTD